jgi:hypothetical protein
MSTLGGIAVFQNLAPGEFIKTICVRKDEVAPSKGWGCFTEPPVKSRSAKLGADPATFTARPVTEENSMLISKIAQTSAFAGTVAISLWASAACAQSQAVKDMAKYAPNESISYDFGSKSTSGYFVEQAAKCVVMLMLDEKRDPDAASSSTATRVRLVLDPGQTAGLDSEEGRSLNFTCGERATALLVDAGEREKLIELQRLSSQKTASD